MRRASIDDGYPDRALAQGTTQGIPRRVPFRDSVDSIPEVATTALRRAWSHAAPRSRRPGRGGSDLGRARPRLRVWILACALATGTWLALAPASAAHALLLFAMPAPGVRLAHAPAVIELEFTEPLNHDLSGLHLVGPQGRIEAAVTFPPADPRRMYARLPGLAPGTYDVVWHTLSQIDGHSRAGTYSFSIEDARGRVPAAASSVGPAPAQPPMVPTGLDVLGRWLQLLGLVIALAALLVQPLTRNSGVGHELRGSVSVVFGACALVALGILEAVISAAIDSGGPGMLPGFLAGSLAGRWAIVEVLAIAGLAAAFVLLPPRAATAAGWVAALAVMSGLAATAHAAAGPGAGWGTAIMLLHVASASLWLAAVGAVAWALVRRRRRPQPADGAADAVVLGRLAQVASISGVAVVASGACAALIEVPSVDALVSTPYGQALVAKGLLVTALLGVAAFNALVAAPRRARALVAGSGPDWLGRTIPVELCIGGLVLLAAAVLSQLAPAGAEVATRTAERRIAASDNPADAVSAMTAFDGGVLTLNLAPVAPGPNQIDVDVPLDLQGARPSSVRLVDPSGVVRASGSLSRTGAEGPSIAYDGFVTINPTAGDWTADLTLQTGDGTRSVRFILPIVASAGASSAGTPAAGPWSSPAPNVPAGVFAAVALAALAALTWIRGLTGRRPARWPRRAPVVGGALAGAALLVGGSIGSSASLAPSPGGWAGPWGTATVARRVATHAGQEYGVPTPAASLMNPAIDPQGDLWVAEMNTNKILELDPHAGTERELSLPPPIDLLMGLAIDPIRDRVWFAEEQSNAIGELDPATGSIRTFRVPAHAAPYGVAVAADGSVWFTEQALDAIARLDPVTGTVRQWPIPTPSSTPYWLAVAPDGRVWFTELQGNAVGVLDPATGGIHEFRGPATQGQPSGIAIAPTGQVWFATLGGAVGSIDPSSGRMTDHAGGSVQGLYGVAVDSDGHVWVGSLEGRVLRFDIASSAMTVLDVGTANAGAWWPAVDGAGTVWVVEESNQANRLVRLAGG